jgi:hypothetical protein
VLAVAKLKKNAGQITLERRDRAAERRKGERREKPGAVVVERRTLERRAKVSRRRQIDPTTCERDYTDDEVEFMNALNEYKRTSGRMFPCSEVLEVVRGLGYIKPQTGGEQRM